MTFTSRAMRGLIVFGVALSSVAALSAEWLDPSESLECAIALLENQRKQAKLSRQLLSMKERSERKETVASELIEGKVSLFEAAARFRSLHEKPFSWCDPRSPRPEREDGEAWCRVVIDWTASKMSFERSPGESEMLRRRWEKELQDYLQSHCTVDLQN